MVKIKLFHYVISLTLLHRCEVWVPSLRHFSWAYIERVLFNVLSISIWVKIIIPNSIILVGFYAYLILIHVIFHVIKLLNNVHHMILQLLIRRDTLSQHSNPSILLNVKAFSSVDNHNPPLLCDPQACISSSYLPLSTQI